MLASQIGKQNCKPYLHQLAWGLSASHLSHLGLSISIFKLRALSKDDHNGLFPILTLYESAITQSLP